MLIINDAHIGFDRKGGTTQATQEALRTYLFDQLTTLLSNSDQFELLINGDLFDDFDITPRDWIQTYLLLSNWCRTRRLYLVAGNHDHSPRALKVSAFEMLANVLKHEYSDNVVVVGVGEAAVLRTADEGNTVIALAHCANQDLFDQKLKEILGEIAHGGVVFLHANYDNKFAVQSDHSLNVSEDLARQFKAVDAKLVFAHEHQARKLFGGSVIVMGNQWPTSVADCLGNDSKAAHVLTKDLELVPLTTWEANSAVGYREIDWRELANTAADVAGFIRVTGQSSSNEASDVVNTIAAFRQRSGAFVVTNAVKVEGIVEADELPESFEATKKFDVLEYIKGHLTSEEMVVVEGLLKEN